MPVDTRVFLFCWESDSDLNVQTCFGKLKATLICPCMAVGLAACSTTNPPTNMISLKPTTSTNKTAVADTVRNELAPGGKLRAAINFGNPILANKDATTSEARGVSVDLAHELGKRLGVPVELVTYTAAGKVV